MRSLSLLTPILLLPRFSFFLSLSLCACVCVLLAAIKKKKAWPHVSSSFGAYDLAGFAKAAVWWYRAWWLGNVSYGDAGRPPLPSAATGVFVHIVESWMPSPNSAVRVINVYSNAPLIRLSLNGAPVAAPQAVPAFGYARFSVTCASLFFFSLS